MSITIDENRETWFIFCFIGLTTLDLRLLEIFFVKCNYISTVEIQNLTIRRPETFENRTFLYPVFEWSTIRKPIFSFCFQMTFKSQKFFHRFLNSIRKPDHLGTNLLLTIRKPDTSGCWIPTVFVWPNATKLQFNVWPELSNCHNLIV